MLSRMLDCFLGRLGIGIGLFVGMYLGIKGVTAASPSLTDSILPGWDSWQRFFFDFGSLGGIPERLPMMALLLLVSIAAGFLLGRSVTRIAVPTLLLASVFGIALSVSAQKRLLSARLSDQNHANHIEMALLLEWHDREEAGEAPTLPYEAEVPGHLMLTRFLSEKPGYLNCNHAALNSRVGGWQAVNLPPDTWNAVAERWPHQSQDLSIPFFWCGRPNGLNQRVVTTVAFGSGYARPPFLQEEGEIADESTLQAAVNTLNAILDELGEPPVPLNVPNDVDWTAPR